MRSNGGIIGAKKTVSTSAASGIWAIRDAQRERGASNWPSFGDFESIATTTVGSGGSSTVTFSSIPATYKHLQIRCLTGSSNPTASMSINFNNDSTSANYRNHYLYGSGASAASSSDPNSSLIGVQGSGMTTGPAVHIIDILDYANTNKYKTLRELSGYDANGSGYIFHYSLLWMSTAAINQVSIIRQISGFLEYSHLALYGIRG